MCLQLLDTNPPLLTPLLVTGEQRIRADPLNAGVPVTAVRITIEVLEGEGESWKDPGCSASDAVDGDLSPKVMQAKI